MTDPRTQRPDPDQGTTLSPGPARTATSSSSAAPGSAAAGPAAASGGAAPPGSLPPGGNAKWWTLVAVCLGTFMLLLDITIVNVALPDIQTALDASFSDLQWVIDAYALSWPRCC